MEKDQIEKELKESKVDEKKRITIKEKRKMKKSKKIKLKLLKEQEIIYLFKCL